MFPASRHLRARNQSRLKLIHTTHTYQPSPTCSAMKTSNVPADGTSVESFLRTTTLTPCDAKAYDKRSHILKPVINWLGIPYEHAHTFVKLVLLDIPGKAFAEETRKGLEKQFARTLPPRGVLALHNPDQPQKGLESVDVSHIENVRRTHQDRPIRNEAHNDPRLEPPSPEKRNRYPALRA